MDLLPILNRADKFLNLLKLIQNTNYVLLSGNFPFSSDTLWKLGFLKFFFENGIIDLQTPKSKV